LDDLPQTGDDIGEQAAAKAMKLQRCDLSHANQASEDGVNLGDAESREIMAAAVSARRLSTLAVPSSAR
jgi:hypothetical protein